MSNDQLSWFHGKLTRQDADELIQQEGNEDGTFLIRESSSAVGDFVLTLLYQNEVRHYQIRRHGEDAFFSIDDKIKILHGLDTLVDFYKQAPNGLVTQLTKHIKKDPPPNDSRSHGVTNLLHRATKENNQTVVSELLKCGYRNVDAKNQEGQTAVHLAAQHCDEEILKVLLAADVNVNCMDSSGNMPLHYACRYKPASFIHILVGAGANVQGRNIKNGFVPLHEAAKYGNLDAVKELLSLHAPLLPRTSFGEFPIDLAKEAGHDEVVSFLQSYKLPPPITFQNKWYHGTLSRDEAIETLTAFAVKMEQDASISPTCTSPETDVHQQKNSEQYDISQQQNSTKDSVIDTSGCFLVRYSERKGAGTGYVLTLLWDKNVKNFIISQSSNYLYIDNGPYLPTLEHLVEHFMRFSDGLPVNLKYPVPPKPKPPLPLFSTMPRNHHAKRSLDGCSPLTPTSPLQTDHLRSKDDQSRKFSLDAQKNNKIVAERAQTLVLKKKKPKEISSSVFSTLRLRSPKKSIDSLRKKSKSPAGKEKSDAEKDIDNPITDRTAESLLKDLSFSTDFSTLTIAGEDSTFNSPIRAVTSDSSVAVSVSGEAFYNVPKNNSAVISTIVTTDSDDPTTDTIEEKTEAEVEYFTKSDIEIEKERAALTVSNGAEKLNVSSMGYIPTMDIRIFADPLNGEFSQAMPDSIVTQLRGVQSYGRIDSIISTMSNESAVNRFLNRQQSNISTTTTQSSDAQQSTKLNYFIPCEMLELQTVIGEGEFGSVYKGRLRRFESSGQDASNKDKDAEIYFDCAIKTLRDDHQRIQEFLREASVMIRLQHHCIVQLIGISKGETLMMVQELVPLGSMLHFILDNKSKINPNYELKLWASQIACGMQYLESHHFVHRDLAARNILLASMHQAKISDFGLSRALGSGNDCYQASQGGKWPIKWYAPESFNNGLFSHASDVWSFGVTLWEMFSLGQPPFGDLRGVEAIQLIENGDRLPQPNLCPDHVYEIMRNCWNYKPKDRPTFRYLTDFFAKDPDYENIMEMIKTKHIG